MSGITSGITGKSVLRIVFVLSLGLNIALSIHLFTPTPPPAHREIETEALNLSPQQKESIHTIRTAIHDKNQTLRRRIAEWDRKLLAALGREAVDRAEVNRCIDSVSDLQKQIQLNTAEEIIRIKEVMTVDQCNCLMRNLDSAFSGVDRPCNCPHCRTRTITSPKQPPKQTGKI